MRISMKVVWRNLDSPSKNKKNNVVSFEFLVFNLDLRKP